MADIDLSAFTNIVPLGSGGLGDVYRATRRSTGGEVAIKVLRDWSDHDVARQRTQRELNALVGLRGHANVVNIEEVIESDDALAIVMEYAPGGSVSDLMRDQGGTLDFPETLLVATHAAAALGASHARGIIHRDIKPHNLIIGSFGQVKVCDFGIAALTHSEDASNRTSSLSLRYASPEELRGDEEVGPPADIYSLAATIHQLLTGQYLPIPDGTAGSLPLRSWTAPDDLPADVEVEFRDLVVKSADRNPANRPTAEELHDRFEALAVRLGPARCRALPLVDRDLDDATSIRSVSVVDAGPAPSSAAEPAATSVRPSAAVPDPASTVVRTTRVEPAEPTAPGPRRARGGLMAAAAAAAILLVLGGTGFALGWFGDDDGDAAAATTTAPADDDLAAPTDPPTASTAATTAAPTTEAATTTTSPATTTTVAPTTTTTSTTTTTTSTTTTTTLPERYAGPVCPGDGSCITMASIDIVDGEYSIAWSANFTPSNSGTHAHFFWDVYEPSQVGSSAANRAPWELTDQQPFVPGGEMRLANRPAEATGICVTPANGSHQVIDPSYYHCALVPAGESWVAP